MRGLVLRTGCLLAAALSGAAWSPVLEAEVRSLSAGGFTTTHVREIDAGPDRVYAALTGRISEWWEEDHSWSGDASNLYLDARPGGCFCERLDGDGWVEHLRIVYLAPGRELRLRGSLGPLMNLGLVGTMTWRLEPVENRTRIHWTYVVQGHVDGGFEQLAPVVDRVNAAQLDGLAALFDSG